MNILVVHEADYINQVVYEYQIIPEILASKGHRVYVIDYSSKMKKGDQFLDRLSLKTKYFYHLKKSGKKAGVVLIRPGIIKIPGLGRLSAFFTHFLVIGKTIKKHQINQIILYSVATNGLQTIFWAKVFNIPVLYRLLDVIHQLVPNKLASPLIYIIEKLIYRHSDILLAVTPRITKYAIKMGANPKTTSYLPSGADFDLFYPTQKSKKLLKKYGLGQNDLIILFAGTLYRFSGLDKIISRLPKYLPKIPNLKLLIIGCGEQEEKLQKLIKRFKLEKRVILTGFIQYEKLAKYINLADIGFNSFEISPATNIIFPGKIYQYLACAKPTLATKLQGITDIFPVNDSNKSGIYYYDKEEEFFELIPKIKGKPIKDPNPSLQQIASVIEEKLETMKR